VGTGCHAAPATWPIGTGSRKPSSGGTGSTPNTAAGSGRVTSATRELHSPQDGHRPTQRGAVDPQVVQRNVVCAFAMGSKVPRGCDTNPSGCFLMYFAPVSGANTSGSNRR